MGLRNGLPPAPFQLDGILATGFQTDGPREHRHRVNLFGAGRGRSPPATDRLHAKTSHRVAPALIRVRKRWRADEPSLGRAVPFGVHVSNLKGYRGSLASS